MLSGKKQAQQVTYYCIPLTQHSQSDKNYKNGEQISSYQCTGIAMREKSNYN
jgi:hypothetical protein